MNDFKDIKVAVAGTGYVGLSIAFHEMPMVDCMQLNGYFFPAYFIIQSFCSSVNW